MKQKKFLKKKGMSMTDSMLDHPERYNNRICVAYDKNKTSRPKMYILVGTHDHSNEHELRKLYAESNRINYFDTRVILYNTFITRRSRDEVFYYG
jgi:hypothetical protein